MIDKKDDDFLGQNIKGMMMTLIAQWNAEMDDARQNTEFSSVRPGDMRVFAQLRGRNLKLSAIHREMGFSRQAAQQAVDRLVQQDMIALSQDPDSKRDKQVTITEKGQRWRAIAAGNIRSIEESIAKTLGSNGREALRAQLQSLVASGEGRS